MYQPLSQHRREPAFDLRQKRAVMATEIVDEKPLSFLDVHGEENGYYSLAAHAALFTSNYGAKYPNMSSTRRVGLLGNALMLLLDVGTIARFDVTAPSNAFNVDTAGWLCPCGHNVRYPSAPAGTTVALSTYACAPDGMPQLSPAATSRVVPLVDSHPAHGTAAS